MSVESIRTEGPYQPSVSYVDGSYVQIGVEPTTDLSMFWFMFGDDAERLGTQIIDLVETEKERSTAELVGEMVIALLEDVSEGPSEGLWATLDREQCNDLIRALRKARNKAYGEDA
jgi:hypothetical protein